MRMKDRPFNSRKHLPGREQSAGFLGNERFRVTPRKKSLIVGEAQPIGAHSINWKVFLSNDDVFGVSKTDRKI